MKINSNPPILYYGFNNIVNVNSPVNLQIMLLHASTDLNILVYAVEHVYYKNKHY